MSVSFFSSSDCTDDFLSNVPTDTGSFPNWALREAKGVLAPANANSARIELNAEATGAGTIMNISWDNVILDGLSPPGLESSDQLYFAHFGNGQGFTSDTVLTNPSPTRTAARTVSYSDDDGNPLPVGFASAGDGIVPLAIASSVNFSIPPLGALTIATDGQGEVKAGAAVVTSDNPLGGVIRFSIPGIGIAGVGASQPLSEFIIPVRRKAGGINTGVAIYNTESTPVQIALKLHETLGQITPAGLEALQDGEPIATTSIEDFPAGGHVAKFINELFPDTDTDNFEGTLVVQVTGGKVAATALELGTQPGEFTTLPVTALQD